MIGLDPDARSRSLLILQMMCIRYLCFGSYGTKEKMAFKSVDSNLCGESANRDGDVCAELFAFGVPCTL